MIDRIPKVGSQVIYFPNRDADPSDAPFLPAFVTRVFTKDCVNLFVMGSGREAFTPISRARGFQPGQWEWDCNWDQLDRKPQ